MNLKLQIKVCITYKMFLHLILSMRCDDFFSSTFFEKKGFNGLFLEARALAEAHALRTVASKCALDATCWIISR